MAVFDEMPPAQPEYEATPSDRPEDSDASRWRGSSGGADRMAPAPMTAAPPPPPPPKAAALGAGASSRADTSEAVVTAQRREERLGTAHGRIERSVMNIEAFERATSYPRFIREVRYDSYDNLVASGVIQPAWNEGHGPRPFPGRSDTEGYVPDPPLER